MNKAVASTKCHGFFMLNHLIPYAIFLLDIPIEICYNPYIIRKDIDKNERQNMDKRRDKRKHNGR